MLLKNPTRPAIDIKLTSELFSIKLLLILSTRMDIFFNFKLKYMFFCDFWEEEVLRHRQLVKQTDIKKNLVRALKKSSNWISYWWQKLTTKLFTIEV